MDFDIKKVVVIKGSKLEFSLKTKVGAGGNGIVYDVDIISSKIKVQDRDYVVKILKNDQTKMGERKRRFINEINSARKLCRLFNNKKILPIIDCNIDDTDNNDLWYVMPKAKPLWQFLKERNSIREKIRYMIQVAEIIKSLRDNKCAHRDIKPDNIFLLDNEVFLGDLGIVQFAPFGGRCCVLQRLPGADKRLVSLWLFCANYHSIMFCSSFDYRISRNLIVEYHRCPAFWFTLRAYDCALF